MAFDTIHYCRTHHIPSFSFLMDHTKRVSVSWGTFNPRVLPENTYLKQLQEDTTDSVQKFIDQCEPREYTGNDLYRLYREYCTEEGIYSYTNTKFSMQLLFLKENGSIFRPVERHNTKKSNNYIIK